MNAFNNPNIFVERLLIFNNGFFNAKSTTRTVNTIYNEALANNDKKYCKEDNFFELDKL